MTARRRHFGLPLFGIVLFSAIVVWLVHSKETSSPPLLQMPPARSAGAVFNPEIRVRLTTSSTPSIRCDGGYEIKLLGTNRVLARGSRLLASEISPTSNGIDVGTQPLHATRIEIVPANSPSLCVDGRQYRGTLRIYRMRNADLLIVNVLPLEEYLASVVDSEMPIAFGVEARRAQAIAARTYALYQMQQNRTHPYFDVFDSERSQKYHGTKYENSDKQLWAGESESSRSVVADTAGIVCLHEGKLFCTYFSAACGGRTTLGTDLFSDAAAPLKPVHCEWCRDADRYRWTKTIARSELQSSLKSKGSNTPRVTAISSIRDTNGDLLASRPTDVLTLGDGANSVKITHEELRSALPAGRLPSPLFRVQLAGDEVVIHGRGHGHGVGFCQWGARGQANAGRTALEILSTYYPGSQLVRLTPRAAR